MTATSTPKPPPIAAAAIDVCHPWAESTWTKIKIDPMVQLLEQHLIFCPDWQKGKKKNKLTVSFLSISVAASMKTQCVKCGYTATGQKASATDMPLPDSAASELIERNSDYTTNVLCFLLFWQRVDFAGLLGLPKATSMETVGFKSVESMVGPQIQEIGRDWTRLGHSSEWVIE